MYKKLRIYVNIPEHARFRPSGQPHGMYISLCKNTASTFGCEERRVRMKGVWNSSISMISNQTLDEQMVKND